MRASTHPQKPRDGPSGGRKFRADTKVKSSFNYPWGHSLTELVLGIGGVLARDWAQISAIVFCALSATKEFYRYGATKPFPVRCSRV